MHGLPYLAALHDERRLDALLRLDQVMVDGADGQQRRYGGMGFVKSPVAEDDVVDAAVHGRLGLAAEAVQGLLQPGLSLRFLEQDGQDLGVETLVADVAEHVELVVGQDRLGKADHLAVALVRGEDVHAHGADVLGKGHDEVLAYRVDGRVRHLGELLAEVIEQQLGTLGQGRQLGVVAHGRDRLGGRAAHGHDYALNVLPGVVEGP